MDGSSQLGSEVLLFARQTGKRQLQVRAVLFAMFGEWDLGVSASGVQVDCRGVEHHAEWRKELLNPIWVRKKSEPLWIRSLKWKHGPHSHIAGLVGIVNDKNSLIEWTILEKHCYVPGCVRSGRFPRSRRVPQPSFTDHWSCQFKQQGIDIDVRSYSELYATGAAVQSEKRKCGY